MRCPICDQVIGFWRIALTLTRYRCPGCKSKLQVAGRRWLLNIGAVVLGMSIGSIQAGVLISLVHVDRIGALSAVLVFCVSYPALVIAGALPHSWYIFKKRTLEKVVKRNWDSNQSSQPPRRPFARLLTVVGLLLIAFSSFVVLRVAVVDYGRPFPRAVLYVVLNAWPAHIAVAVSLIVLAVAVFKNRKWFSPGSPAETQQSGPRFRLRAWLSRTEDRLLPPNDHSPGARLRTLLRRATWVLAAAFLVAALAVHSWQDEPDGLFDVSYDAFGPDGWELVLDVIWQNRKSGKLPTLDELKRDHAEVLDRNGFPINTRSEVLPFVHLHGEKVSGALRGYAVAYYQSRDGASVDPDMRAVCVYPKPPNYRMWRLEYLYYDKSTDEHETWYADAFTTPLPDRILTKQELSCDPRWTTRYNYRQMSPSTEPSRLDVVARYVLAGFILLSAALWLVERRRARTGHARAAQPTAGPSQAD